MISACSPSESRPCSGINLVQQRLSGGTKDDRAAALFTEKIHRIVKHMYAADRQGLDFVENQNRIRHLVHAP